MLANNGKFLIRKRLDEVMNNNVVSVLDIFDFIIADGGFVK